MENTSCADQRWNLPNSSDNAVELREEEEDDEEEEEEALSLSDLPLIHQSRKIEEEESMNPLIRETQDQDFDFCSFSKESEMCTADQVFFQGQILPLRHSISGSSQYSGRSISRSESMDHCFSGRLISSRSSSISSHQSSSSGASSSSAAAGRYTPKLPPRNSFHSYPSPSPRLHLSTHSQRITTNSNHRNSVRIKSSVWNVLRLGLVTSPPEIAFRSSTNCTNFGSRNSTSSNGSSMMSSSSKSSRKKKGFLGGCKCSADAVDTVASKVVIIKRSASENDVVEALHHHQRRNVGELTKKQAAKKQMSHHRTFEWLKQLSVEPTSDEA